MVKKEVSGIKIKCCVCGSTDNMMHPDHVNDRIIKEVLEKGFHDDNSYVCDRCDY